MSGSAAPAALTSRPVTSATVMPLLVAMSGCHLINDTLQALLPSIYPNLHGAYGFNFTQLSLITFVYQMTGSVLQPLVGLYTDRHPKPYSLAVGMALTLLGLALLAYAHTYPMFLFASAFVGVGSAIFHPEASRLARIASGGRHGFAQSLFQVGGNFGSALGPLAAAYIITPRGQTHILWFTALALLGVVILARVGTWYARQLTLLQKDKHAAPASRITPLSPRQTRRAFAILIALIFSKYIYLVSFTNFFTFYLIDRFHVSVQASQIYLFLFLLAVAAGTFLGGPFGDRYGRKLVIWISILGVAPFSLLLPHVGLALTALLSVIAGFILASAFSAIVVYGQELLPGRVGLVAGLFFGLAFGTAGIAASLLGKLADHTSIRHVYEVCAYLPLIGLLTAFLPDIEKRLAPA